MFVSKKDTEGNELTLYKCTHCGDKVWFNSQMDKSLLNPGSFTCWECFKVNGYQPVEEEN